MHETRFSSLEEAGRTLVEAALDASRNAYAPYSGFAVGAAVRTKSGKVYPGANLENAAYGVTMCAEVAALTAANTAGDFEVEAIAVTGFKFLAPIERKMVVTPCGRCRQMIAEAAQISGTDVIVHSCNGDLSEIVAAPISELLPLAFGPKNLGLVSVWPKMRAALQSQDVRAQDVRAYDEA